MNPYKTLNVKKDAGEEAVRGAYRALSKQYHPDMPEGSTEKFGELQRARDVLLNPELRAQFDETGIMPDSDDAKLLNDARTLMADAFGALIRQVPPEQLERTDIMAELRAHFKAAEEKMHNDIATLQRNADRLLKSKALIEKRVKKKKGSAGDNIFLSTVSRIHAEMLAGAAGGSENLKLLAKVHELLDDYSFEVTLSDMFNVRFTA